MLDKHAEPDLVLKYLDFFSSTLHPNTFVLNIQGALRNKPLKVARGAICPKRVSSSALQIHMKTMVVLTKQSDWSHIASICADDSKIVVAILNFVVTKDLVINLTFSCL